MPHISIDGPHLNREQKAELVKEFTEIASRIMKIPKEAFVIVIKENDPENVGVGGKLLADREK